MYTVKPITLNILIGLVMFVLSSCSEEPIGPTDPPPPPVLLDTVSKYNWEVEHIGGNLGNIYVADSTNIWIETGTSCIYYDSKTYQIVQFNSPGFSFERVHGYDKNNVFFGGAKRISQNHIIPQMFKMENGVLQSYIYDSVGVSYWDVFPTGPDEVWLSTTEGNEVYRFNNGTFTTYTLDSNVRRGWFYMDPAGTLYLFAFNLQIGGGFIYSYRYNGNSFETVNVAVLNYNGPGLTDYLHRCGSDILMTSQSSHIFIFDGINWVFHSAMKSPSVFVSPAKLGGVSKDSLVALTYQNGRMYTYNGKTWRLENSSPLFEPVSDTPITSFFIKEGIAYGTLSSYNIGYAYLITGRPKTNSINSNGLKNEKITLSNYNHTD